MNDLSVETYRNETHEYEYDHSPSEGYGNPLGDSQVSRDWSYRIAWRRIGDESWNVLTRSYAVVSDDEGDYDEEPNNTGMILMRCDEIGTSQCDEPMWPDDMEDADYSYEIIDNLGFWRLGTPDDHFRIGTEQAQRDAFAHHRADVQAIKNGWWV